MSRNLWDDWNEDDVHLGTKFDMYTDDVKSSIDLTVAPQSILHASSPLNDNGSFEQQYQQNAGANTIHADHSHALDGSLARASVDQHNVRINMQRSLSDDIVNMLDDADETTFSKQLGAVPRDSNGDMHRMIFDVAAAEQNTTGFQQQQQYLMQMQHDQQYQQQHFGQQHFQQFSAQSTSSWMNNFGGGDQIHATTSTPVSGTNSNPSGFRHHLHSINMTAMDEGAALPNVRYPAPRAPTTADASSSLMPRVDYTSQHVSSLASPTGKVRAASARSSTTSASRSASKYASAAMKTTDVGTDSNNHTAASVASILPQQANGIGTQGVMVNPFMMYSMMGLQGMNMVGMPMQMPTGMNVNGMMPAMPIPARMNTNGMSGMNGMNGMTPAMQMQLQLQLQMQIAQMAQVNGMGLMQMPMGLPGVPMGANMQMPVSINMQQQQVDSHSGLSHDVEMTSAFPMEVPVAEGSTLKPARTMQRNGARGGPGFVNIARKPEESEVSSILKSLMDEEAKKKGKKLERNRDSARESRRKQQTYVETLENGIKCLQINRNLVRSYQWGVSGPEFGSESRSTSSEMSNWEKHVEVVTGRTEAFSRIQKPANFQSLMQLNRQRRTLSMQHDERERAVWKCFRLVGRQLAAIRTSVLQVQMLRTFSGNPLAAELDSLLNLSAGQKRQLQCHAQQMFNEEIVELTKLFKIFFALRNEALRLNILSPSLERYFRETCSFDQLQKLLQWTENHRTVIESDLSIDAV
uniref:BZIP domain-containing protein n=1 Tax=Hyaloperonospora arabidopsidis (strain Emoy2) TaxID=559515 RepID=M4C006_HYAAE